MTWLPRWLVLHRFARVIGSRNNSLGPRHAWRSRRGLLSGTAAGWRRETALRKFLAKKSSR
jgi:hypothetical protein